MNHTTYYQLSLWEQDDRIMREDFNDNNAKIDAALGALAAHSCVIGSYVGNDAEEGQQITLGFRPKFVIVATHYWNQDLDGITKSRTLFSAISEANPPECNNCLTEDGFTVRGAWFAMNKSGETYHYIAFR